MKKELSNIIRVKTGAREGVLCRGCCGVGGGGGGLCAAYKYYAK